MISVDKAMRNGEATVIKMHGYGCEVIYRKLGDLERVHFSGGVEVKEMKEIILKLAEVLGNER